MKLGKLQEIDIREVWTHEQYDFSKWLSAEDNIQELGNVLNPPIKEQDAIAEVLSAADREIDLLQQDIEQEKQKKKALMQLLLTGIVRVTI